MDNRWSLLPKDSLDENKSQKEEISDQNLLHLHLKQRGSRKYRSEALSLLRVDGIIVSKSSTTTDFSCTVNEVGLNSIVLVETLRTHVDNSIKELDEYNYLLNKISSVKSSLLLKIDKDGMIADILNKDELREKWLVVKGFLLEDRKFNLFKAEDQKLIIKGGDDEFLKDFDAVEFLNRGYTIYSMLFSGYYKDYEVKKTYPLDQKFKNSSLFKDQIIPLYFETQIKRYFKESNSCQLETQGVEADHFDDSHLKKMYLEVYPFAKSPFDSYAYDSSGDYEMDINTGLIKRMNMTVVEQAGSVEMFMDCNLKELINEKSNITE